MRSGKLVLRRFWQDLSDISARFDDVTDTAVREALFRTINYHFIWDLPLPDEPKCFLMLSPEGDQAVAEAIRIFFQHLMESDAVKLLPGVERHRFIHDYEIKTYEGFSYERFIGTGEFAPPMVALPRAYSVFRCGETGSG